MGKYSIIKGLVIGILLTAALTVPSMKIFDAPIFGVDSALAFWPSFGGEEKPDVKTLVNNIKPKDKFVTYDDTVVIDTGNGEKKTVKLKVIGKNSVVIGLKLEDGKKIKVLRRILRLTEFKDVEKGYWAKKRIELCVAAGLIDKGKSKYFRPEGTITRAKFAKLLAKAVGIKPVKPKTTVANDVSATDNSSKYINYAVNVRRFMELDAQGNFRPEEKITRGEAIAAICRLEGIKENWDMYESPFEDLHPRHKYARYIDAAKKAEFLKFAEERSIIDVDGLLTNAELAYLLTKTTVGKKAVAELLNWEVGYEVEETGTKKLAAK